MTRSWCAASLYCYIALVGILLEIRGLLEAVFRFCDLEAELLFMMNTRSTDNFSLIAKHPPDSISDVTLFNSRLFLVLFTHAYLIER